MPVITCLKCGNVTNTTVSEWIDCKKNDGLKKGPLYARGCYAYFKDEGWHKGCIYMKGGVFYKNFVNKLIKENKQRRKNDKPKKVT